MNKLPWLYRSYGVELGLLYAAREFIASAASVDHFFRLGPSSKATKIFLGVALVFSVVPDVRNPLWQAFRAATLCVVGTTN